jgi:hypothetical protein
VSQGKEVV